MKPIVTLLVVLISVAAQAQTPQVVVLRNGNVLQGQVDRLADGYYVTTESSEFRLAARDVERIAATVQDAYVAKLADVREDSASDRLALASWCMQQQLWQAAANELAAARAISSRNPQIGYLERRLAVMSEAANRTEPAVQTVETDHTAEQRAAENARLEALAAELPAGTLEDFARHVQPILVNGCATGGCHSTGDKREFSLNRDLIRGVANRESTLRNLEAVMKFVDRQTPEYSPLLLQPAVPHGGLPHPVFSGPRQKVQDRLVEWVNKATGHDQVETPAAPGSEVEVASHQTSTASQTAPEMTPAATPKAPEHFWEDPAALGVEGESAEAVAAAPAEIKFGLTAKRFEPRDEFDPELFNRQMKPDAP